MNPFEEIKKAENQVRDLLTIVNKTKPELANDYNEILDRYIKTYLTLGKDEILSDPHYTVEILSRINDIKLILERYIKMHSLKENIKNIIKEELKRALNEKYQDQFKLKGRLITNIKHRPQQEILSDIRAIPGITVVSTTELEDYAEQNFNQFTTILNLKIDGYPWIKRGGFSRETIKSIAKEINKVPDVVSFRYNPKTIEPI